MEETKRKELHVGVVLDGNRRFAKKQGWMPWKGHAKGASKVKDLIEWSPDLGIDELTLYTFSVENFNRPEKEKEEIFKLFRENFGKLQEKKDEDDKKVKITFIGRLEMFPEDIQDMMKEIMEETKNNKGLIINFAVAYGGRSEIVDAVKKMIKNGVKEDEVVEEAISKNLYMSNEPNIIIRPGGERRISNFLIWQSHYSEWFFLEKLWPEITKDDLNNILDEFNSRERRFGK